MKDSLLQQFSTNGYAIVRQAVSSEQLVRISPVIEAFHAKWKTDNHNWYQTGAVNSAYLTAPAGLNTQQRLQIFEFLASAPLMTGITSLLGNTLCFMNTQLFFNPVNPGQHNYWHRDCQYHLDLTQQQAGLKGPQVIHLRVPLMDEQGVELVPGSHIRWDNQQQLDVRLGQHGAQHHDPLPDGLKITLRRGDLLLFSANMLHRGLYNAERLALDVLYCQPEEECMQFVREDCLPEPAMMSLLAMPEAFVNSIRYKNKA